MDIKKIGILFIILSLSFIVGCGMFESEFVVSVTGTSWMKVQGAYMITTPTGSSVSKSVNFTIPGEFKVKGDIVSVSFQKQSQEGYLKVEIYKNGRLVSSSDTDAPYGVVSAATR